MFYVYTHTWTRGHMYFLLAINCQSVTWQTSNLFSSMAFCSGAVVRLQVMTTRLIEQSCSAVSQEAKGLERSEFRSHIHLQGYIYIYMLHFCCHYQQFMAKSNLGVKVVDLNLQFQVSVHRSREVKAGILSS